MGQRAWKGVGRMAAACLAVAGCEVSSDDCVEDCGGAADTGAESDDSGGMDSAGVNDTGELPDSGGDATVGSASDSDFPCDLDLNVDSDAGQIDRWESTLSVCREPLDRITPEQPFALSIATWAVRGLDSSGRVACRIVSETLLFGSTESVSLSGCSECDYLHGSASWMGSAVGGCPDGVYTVPAFNGLVEVRAIVTREDGPSEIWTLADDYKRAFGMDEVLFDRWKRWSTWSASKTIDEPF